MFAALTAAVALALPQTAKDRMTPLHWMAGIWEGTGYQMSGDRKIEIRCTEIVEIKSSGAVIAITDIQSTKAPGQAEFGPKREAFFTVSTPDKFVLTAFVPSGATIVSDVTVTDGRMEWSYPNSPVQMSLGKGTAGEWVEQGHTTSPEGRKLVFELRLRRVAKPQTD